MKPLPHPNTHRPVPDVPVTIGDFLLKRRTELNLTQKQVAEEILHTSIANIGNWESNRNTISLLFLPKVYEFIGYFPCDNSLSLGLRLKERRENFGFPIKKLSKILKIDPCTIAYWERGDHQPSLKSLTIINGFLKEFTFEKILEA